jgi:hypothetical protein
VVVYFEGIPLVATKVFIRPVRTVKRDTRDAASANVLASISAARAVVMPECRQCDHAHSTLEGLSTPVSFSDLYPTPAFETLSRHHLAQDLEDGARRGWPGRRYDAAEPLLHVWPDAVLALKPDSPGDRPP